MNTSEFHLLVGIKHFVLGPFLAVAFVFPHVFLDELDLDLVVCEDLVKTVDHVRQGFGFLKRYIILTRLPIVLNHFGF